LSLFPPSHRCILRIQTPTPGCGRVDAQHGPLSCIDSSQPGSGGQAAVKQEPLVHSMLILCPPAYITWYNWDVLVHLRRRKKCLLTSPMSLPRRRPSLLSGMSSVVSLLSLSCVGSCPTFHKPSHETLDKEHSTVTAGELVLLLLRRRRRLLSTCNTNTNTHRHKQTHLHCPTTEPCRFGLRKWVVCPEADSMGRVTSEGLVAVLHE